MYSIYLKVLYNILGIVGLCSMAENDLNSFREKWKHEITTKQGLAENCANIQRHDKNDSTTGNMLEEKNPNIQGKIFHTNTATVCKGFDNAENYSIVSKKPKLEPNQPIALLTLEIPSYHQSEGGGNTSNVNTSNQSNASLPIQDGNEDLLSLLIRDIDETTSIPFFDISLPKEVCLKIFGHLNVTDLCRCSCVSKAWASIANDELLWYNIYKRQAFEDQRNDVWDQVNWKSLVKNEMLRQRLVTQNWKERICQIQTFEYEKGLASHSEL